MEKKNNIEKVGNKIITLHNTQVIIDRDVAEIYGVPTRDINKAVKNNPRKFPDGYIIELNTKEKSELVENFHRFEPLKHSTVAPKAFTEKGLYMLATILKSQVATDATIAIIETFTKLRELARTIEAVNEETEKPDESKLQRLMTEVFTDNLPVQIKKTTFTLNTGVIKFTAGENITINAEEDATIYYRWSSKSNATWADDAAFIEGRTGYVGTAQTSSSTTGDRYLYVKAFRGDKSSDIVMLHVVVSEATAINNVNGNANGNENQNIKVIKNGKLYIGKYNIAGQQVK